MRVVLGNGGGLNTALSLHRLRQMGHEVVCAHVDLLEEPGANHLERIRLEALALGAAESYTLYASRQFAEEYLVHALAAHPVYDGGYNLSAALSRPLVVAKLIEFAREREVPAIAHGSHGHRNDFVRFNSYARALAPTLEVLTPLQPVSVPRHVLLERARSDGVPLFSRLEPDYQVDENLWGRSLTFSRLDPWEEPPDWAFRWTAIDPTTPGATVTVSLERGVPVALDGRRLSLGSVLRELNHRAGPFGVGRSDIIESRLLGFKRRALYEAPGATVLVAAHRELEFLTCPKELLNFKTHVEQEYARLVYAGHYFSPLMDALLAFLRESQGNVTGDVRIQLAFTGMRVLGRRSPYALILPMPADQPGAEAHELETRAVERLAESLGLSAQAFATLAPQGVPSAADLPSVPALDPEVAQRVLRLAGLKGPE